MFMRLTGELRWQRLRRSAINFYSKKTKNRSLSHPFGHLWVTYALHLWFVGNPVVDFIFVVIELFSLTPTVETLWAEIGRSRRFSKGVGHFERRFRREGASPTNHCWWQSSRVIAFSCGIKKHACDRRTDGQNYDSQHRSRIGSRCNNGYKIFKTLFFSITFSLQCATATCTSFTWLQRLSFALVFSSGYLVLLL